MFGFSFGCNWVININHNFHYGFDHHHWDYNHWDHNSSSDSVILTGETNTDGTGSSVNLSLDNATLSLIGDGSVTQDGVILTHSTSCHSSSTDVYSNVWDENGYKEVKIDSNDDSITVKNIVDVDINNHSHSGVDIDLINVKRGEIDTDCGNDHIDIGVYSNNTLWSNDFDIHTGSGNDTVNMNDVLNTQNTSFNIDLGCGNDSLDVSGLATEGNLDVTRYADGGNGLDTLIFSGQDTVEFDNFEVVTGDNNASLTVGSDLLAANDSSWHGLVLSNIDVNFDDSVTVSHIDDTSWCDSHYLTSLGLDADDYSSLIVTDSDGATFHVLTDDSDYSVA